MTGRLTIAAALAFNFETLKPFLSYTSSMRVLGVDCGGEYTGFGVVEGDGRALTCLTTGAIRLVPREAMELRLKKVFDGLSTLITEYRPDVVAIEDVFYSVNAKSALKLGHVRGVAMMTAAHHGLSVVTYAPLAIKSAVVGYGRAEKSQVQVMVARLLHLDELPQPADAADALAIAICHIHTAATLQRQSAAPR
jgi:crossover junction endodeoxyribonuclease RuvC